MKSKVLNDETERRYLLIFEEGEEFIFTLEKFAEENKITAAYFEGIGAFKNVVVSYFDWERKEYLEIPFNEQVEILSLNGDIACTKDKPKVHAHVVCGRRDGSAVGGHLFKGNIRPTLELILSESDRVLKRIKDPKTGVYLINL
jgi:predicted DNA-binding protein with PD1-like motif